MTNISPKETPLLSGLPSGRTATQTLHEYAQDAFAAYSDNAQAEGSDFSAVDLTAPTRDNNVTQIFKKSVRISGTEIAVNGVVSAWNYQMGKAMTELSKDIELAFMAGSRASGSSGVARRLTGVINALTSNATARNSGSSLGEVAFNDLMQLVWGNTGVQVTEIYTGATLKRDISGFTAGATKFTRIDDGDKRLVNSVDVYESDFGVAKIFKHRNVPSAANGLAIVGINPEYHRISWLTGRYPHMEDVARTGDHRSAQLIAEGTLEHTAKGGADGFYATGFTS